MLETGVRGRINIDYVTAKKQHQPVIYSNGTFEKYPGFVKIFEDLKNVPE